MITNKKRQHYVPQFYLKNFSNNKKGNNYVIYCYDKIDNKIYPNNIKNIAQEEYFNETEEMSIENGLDKHEHASSILINEIIKTEEYPILSNFVVKSYLSSYMLRQIIRTKNIRNQLEDYFQSMIDGENEIPEELKKYDIKDAKEEAKFGHIALTFKEFYDKLDYFVMKKWILIKNKTDINFWTSDNPVAIYNKDGQRFLDKMDTHIFLPLTPKLCLCLNEPTSYSNFKKPIIKNTPEAIIESMFKATEYEMNLEDEVNCINNLQYKFSTRHVFSINKDDLNNLIQ